MTRDELKETVQEMRDNAIAVVRIYARTRCSHVKDEVVRSIEGALGDISIDEAFDVLDRIEREAVAPPAPPTTEKDQ